jgi:hypothetical protein
MSGGLTIAFMWLLFIDSGDLVGLRYLTSLLMSVWGQILQVVERGGQMFELSPAL